MTQTNRQFGLGLVVFAVTALLFVLWDSLVLVPERESGLPFRSGPVVTPVEDTIPARPLRGPADRILLPQSTVRVAVTSLAGVALESATIKSASGAYPVPGFADVPSGLGEAKVSCPGYASQIVHVHEDDLMVKLVPGFSVYGRVFDAVTGKPVSPSIELRDADSRRGVRDFEIGADGEFKWEDIGPGSYMLLGQKRGYLGISSSPKSSLPGLAFDVKDRDLRVEVPMYPVYAGILVLENETNLEDDVFNALVITRSRSAGGIPTPRYFASRMEAEVEAAARREGHGAVFITVRTLVAPGGLSDVQVDLLLANELHAPVSYPLRPVEEVILDGKPHVVAIRRQWTVGELSVESPVALKLVPHRALAGGVALDPGETRLTLPIGDYDIMPVGIGSLLDENLWSVRVRVPEESSVVVSPESGFGTITLEKSDNWQEGMLLVSGEGRSFSLWSHGDFPQVVYATPGKYTFKLVRSGGTGNSRDVLWRRKVKLSRDEAVTVNVGEVR